MFRLFAPDAHWVNVVGMHWRGREAVEHAHRVFFDLMFKGVDQRLEEIESVIALPGGVAVAVVRFYMESFLPTGRRRQTSRELSPHARFGARWPESSNCSRLQRRNS